MTKMNYADRIKRIQDHIETMNHEMGEVQKEIAVIRTNWNWMRLIISGNVGLWALVLGKLIVGC